VKTIAVIIIIIIIIIATIMTETRNDFNKLLLYTELMNG